MPDSTQQSRQATHIASSALDCPLHERAAYVSAACGDDAALEREVQWLLEAAQNTCNDPLLNMPFPIDIEDAALDKGDSVHADLKSEYHITRRIGEGGMGVVYLAQRVVDDVSQPVALKFLHGMVHESRVLERFARERRILAGLEHPNIARLIDGGVTADGRPFLAMEYVQGERIDVWCDKHKLSLRARLKLFLKVCTVVDYAHQRLVIHRDLKPANILVDTDGEPHLLDFGIARLLHTEDNNNLTETGLHAMTPGYASPEQIRGDPLTTATDLWSLAVVLYRLICGVQPFADSMPHKMFTAVLSGVVESPSQRLQQAADCEPVQAARRACGGRLPRDIDAIVMKSLRTDTGERYTSINELASDIDRFLHTQPVQARQGQRLYKMRLFTWRYRVGLSLIALLMLVAGSVAFDRYTQNWANDYQRTRAQSMTNFVSNLFDQVRAVQGEQPMSGLELLDNGARELENRNDLNPHDRISLQMALAHAYIRLGHDERAEPLLKKTLGLLSHARSSLTERGNVLVELSDIYARRGDHAMAAASARIGRGLLEIISVQHEKIARMRLIELTHKTYLSDGSDHALTQALVRAIATEKTDEHARRARALDALSVAQTHERELTAAEHSSRQALAEAGKAFSTVSPSRVVPYRLRLAMRVLARDRVAGFAMMKSFDGDDMQWRNTETLARALVLRELTQASNQHGTATRNLRLLQQMHPSADARTDDTDRAMMLLATEQRKQKTTHGAFDSAGNDTTTMTIEHVDVLDAVGTMLLDGRVEPAAVMAVLQGTQQPRNAFPSRYPSNHFDTTYKMVTTQPDRQRQLTPWIRDQTWIRVFQTDTAPALCPDRSDCVPQRPDEELAVAKDS